MNEPRHYYPRSLFGPLLLAAIGVLFLLRNMGVISYHTIGWWFSHYWPVLLIVWGVIKLLEYTWARKTGRPAPGIGAGGVVPHIPDYVWLGRDHSITRQLGSHGR